jgi:hypothetical protein
MKISALLGDDVANPRRIMADHRHENKQLDRRLHPAPQDPYIQQPLPSLPLHYQPPSQYRSAPHFERLASIPSANGFHCLGTKPCRFEQLYEFKRRETKFLKQELKDAQSRIRTLKVQLQNSEVKRPAPQQNMACKTCSQEHVKHPQGMKPLSDEREVTMLRLRYQRHPAGAVICATRSALTGAMK